MCKELKELKKYWDDAEIEHKIWKEKIIQLQKEYEQWSDNIDKLNGSCISGTEVYIQKQFRYSQLQNSWNTYIDISRERDRAEENYYHRKREIKLNTFIIITTIALVCISIVHMIEFHHIINLLKTISLDQNALIIFL